MKVEEKIKSAAEEEYNYLVLVVLVVDEERDDKRIGLVIARAVGQRLARRQEAAQSHGRQHWPAVRRQAHVWVPAYHHHHHHHTDISHLL
jgi:hypothetical protein